MSDTALIVIDVQELFRHTPYWTDAGLPAFAGRLEALIDGAAERAFPSCRSSMREYAPFAPDSGP